MVYGRAKRSGVRGEVGVWKRPLPLVAAALGLNAWLANLRSLPVVFLELIPVIYLAGGALIHFRISSVGPELARIASGRRRVVLLLLIFSSVWYAGWRVLRLDPQFVQAAALAGTSAWVEGVVVSFPHAAGDGQAREGMILRLDGGMRVRITMPVGQIGCGDRVRCFVSIRWPRPASSPGGFDEAQWLQGQDVMLVGQLHGMAPTVLQRSPVWSLPRALWRIRQALYRSLLSAVGDENADFLAAVVWGDTVGLSSELREGFRLTGMAHVLSVSGSHLALATAPVSLLVGPSGRGRRKQFILHGVWMTLFAALTGFRPSVCRALAMALCARLGPLLMRRSDGYSSLSAAAILLMWIHPRLICADGFLLSVCATAGILLAVDSRKVTSKRTRVGDAVRVSGFAQIASLPVLMRATRTVSLVSIPGWLFLMPVFSVLIPCALLLGVLGFVGHFAWLARLVASLIGWIRGFVMLTARWALMRVGVPFWSPFAACAIWLLLGSLACRVRRHRQIIRGCALMFAFVLLVQWGLQYFQRPDLLIVFADVGQGDCTLIRTRGGFTMLIDCGTETAGRDVVVPMLDWYGVRRIDCCLLTHGHADHAGGFEAVAQRFPIGTLCVGDTQMPLPGDAEDLTEKVTVLAAGKRIRVLQLRSGDSLELAGATRIDILHPQSGALPGNEGSLVTRLAQAGFSLLMTGDAGLETEEHLLRVGRLTDVDVLRVGHHGSKTATGSGFLDAVLPETAIISVGKNTYGHPADETLQRLRERGIAILRTDKDGSIILTWRKNHLSMTRMLGG